MPEPYASEDIDQLVLEHRALMCVYGSAQARCTQEAASQALAVRRMQAQLMRLRAQVIVRDSQLAWEREDRKALEALVPGLPSRAALSRQVVALLARVQDLLHERLRSRLLEPRATVSTTSSGHSTRSSPGGTCWLASRWRSNTLRSSVLMARVPCGPPPCT